MLLALTPAFTLGLPTLAARQTSDEGVGNAQFNWYQDTFLVSQFLSEATSLSGQDLANAASSALGSENDELIHKGVIDSLLPNDPNIQAANNVLVNQGTFQFVVSGLTDLATNGAGYTPAQVLFSVNEINTDRCNLVLPAIDTYLQAAAALSGNAAPAAAARPNNFP
jgi:hypothetical protein